MIKLCVKFTWNRQVGKKDKLSEYIFFLTIQLRRGMGWDEVYSFANHL